MSRRFFAAAALAAAALALSANANAQNANTSANAARTQPPARRQQPSNANTAATPAPVREESDQPPAVEAPAARSRRAPARTGRTAAAEPGAAAVRAVFDTLIRGIERSDVDAVMALYWNSPQLVIFNNNGTVTRGWEQVRSNRASSYPEAKNVKIEARDVRVQMLGREGAVVTCLWRQSQEFRGTPESSAGRLTVAFRLINQGWKIVHTHSSPEAPDPSRLMPSEQAAPPPSLPEVEPARD